MNCKSFLILTTIAGCLVVNPAFGVIKNLGTVGETYPIIEPDIIAELKENAVQHQLSREEIVQRIRTYRPHNLQHLPRAGEDKTTLVDMTYTLDRDLLDGDGKVLYPKGFTFNPLDYVPFTGGMVVLDATDPKQMKWFKNSPYFDNHLARLFITGGSAQDLVNAFKRPVFYLTEPIATRLKIEAVPAVVVPRGKNMVVRIIGDLETWIDD